MDDAKEERRLLQVFGLDFPEQRGYGVTGLVCCCGGKECARHQAGKGKHFFHGMWVWVWFDYDSHCPEGGAGLA